MVLNTAKDFNKTKMEASMRENLCRDKNKAKATTCQSSGMYTRESGSKVGDTDLECLIKLMDTDTKVIFKTAYFLDKVNYKRLRVKYTQENGKMGRSMDLAPYFFRMETNIKETGIKISNTEREL